MPEQTEPLFSQLSESESIKLVFDLTSRIDERVKILIQQHNEASGRIEKLVERQEGILARLSVLENKNGNHYKEDIGEIKKEIKSLEVKVAGLELHSNQHDNRWKNIGDLVFKIVEIVIGGIILWKLGAK